jgi:hypothetical protein
MKSVIEFYKGVRRVVEESDTFVDAGRKAELLDDLTRLYVEFLEARISHEED